MGHSTGLRWGTRYLFKRANRKHGMPTPSESLRTFRLGDIVEVFCNGAVHRGMPHKYYHGQTGTVWSVTPRAVGVLIYRRINNHIAPKRIYVRTEHVRPSKCRDEFLARVKKNQELCLQAKKDGVKVQNLKRMPAGPKEAHFCKPEKIQPIIVTPFRENW